MLHPEPATSADMNPRADIRTRMVDSDRAELPGGREAHQRYRLHRPPRAAGISRIVRVVRFPAVRGQLNQFAPVNSFTRPGHSYSFRSASRMPFEWTEMCRACSSV